MKAKKVSNYELLLDLVLCFATSQLVGISPFHSRTHIVNLQGIFSVFVATIPIWSVCGYGELILKSLQKRYE